MAKPRGRAKGRVRAVGKAVGRAVGKAISRLDENDVRYVWELGHSERETAWAFGTTRYRVHKIASSSIYYGSNVHEVNNRQLQARWREAVKRRQREHPRESLHSSWFYVRSHSALGLRARYDPSEMGRLKRTLKREGS
jgi:hypothetical protein